VRSVLFDLLPNVVPVPEDALVFPGSSGFLCSRYFRETVFRRIVRQALGHVRHHSPHVLRHTWASLHLARGTPIKWVQAQGGWTTAKVLLDVYGHYLPTENRGFEDALAGQDGTIQDQVQRAGANGVGPRSATD
jgi:integrase